MPKIVDHEERRAQIVDAVLTIAVRDGHTEVTSRKVTSELGMSTGALWHYFDNFEQIMHAAAVEVTRRTVDRIDRACAGLRGLARLEATMSQVLPVDPLTQSEARVVVGFWGRAAQQTDPRQSATAVAWRDRFLAALDEAVADGELARDTPRESVADLLRSVSYGQQISHLLDQPTADDHLRLFRSCLRPWQSERPLPM